MGTAGRPGVSRQVRVVFWDAIRAGCTMAAACSRAGVSVRTGTMLFHDAGGVISNGVSACSGWFLSLVEREEIAILSAQGHTRACIARRLGRHKSTIGRELQRNTTSAQHGYRASTAQAAAEKRARRPKPTKLATDDQLRQWVSERLRQRWSPQQISDRLRLEFRHNQEKHLSHETIYQALYVQGKGSLRRELATCLRTGRAVRRPRRMPDARRDRAGRIAGMVNIVRRPAEAADRAVPGHWEGDLIIGKDGASAIGTLVERSTRFCLLLHLPQGKSAEHVATQMINTIHTLPTQLRRSLTWDQGAEMARHAEITLATGLQIYFCDPHSPWQRGTNENTNGLLRQYFPKGTDLSQHGPDHLDNVAAELNARPRKTLGSYTPAEALNRLLSQPNQVATTG